MRMFTVSVFINRSQQDVFDFLSNPANLSKWNTSFESAEWASSGEPGVGSAFRGSSSVLGSKKEMLFEIVQWDPPNRYGYRMNERLLFIINGFESIITLSPKDNGTQVTFESQFEIIGAMKFTEGFFARMSEKGDGENFNTAKRLLEAG